jgi:guanyl-specific ribonuclease Sa
MTTGRINQVTIFYTEERVIPRAEAEFVTSVREYTQLTPGDHDRGYPHAHHRVPCFFSH